MADNVLTGLIPTIYASLNMVSRELVGLIGAVTRNPDGQNLQRAALNQSITYPIVPQGTLEDVTPGQLPADTGNQTFGTGTLTISRSKAYPILWNGEQQKSLRTGDTPRIDEILMKQFMQAYRTLANAMEADLASLYTKTSRAIGTAGTLPFNTAGDLSDFALAKRLLNENGAPEGMRRMVLGNASAGNLRSKMSNLFKVNESGESAFLRDGALGMVQGLMLGESNQIGGHTKGAGTGYLVNGTVAAGATTIPVDTGTGTILAGDVVTFAGDDNKYVVATGITAPGNLEIAAPGLLQAPADDATVTVGDSTNEGNMFFSQDAIVLITRPPALPSVGGAERDDAEERRIVVDPISGIPFEISIYYQYRQVKIEVAVAWGYDVVKPEHIGLLLG